MYLLENHPLHDGAVMRQHGDPREVTPCMRALYVGGFWRKPSLVNRSARTAAEFRSVGRRRAARAGENVRFPSNRPRSAFANAVLKPAGTPAGFKTPEFYGIPWKLADFQLALQLPSISLQAPVDLGNF